ncbi:TetR/AcrR family transcriptional regulator [Pseudomonas yamanorum]|uniref:TetR/AcrR family transcriptional regulator n=1 Tax=Pseudomonas yamanorum TaxID=515393 RepID=UPI003D35BB29
MQERSTARIEKVLEATESLLESMGPEKTSIPAIAIAADVPRAAIYPFFEDKYAIFSHLAVLHMSRLTDAIRASGADQAVDWQSWVEKVIDSVTAYYNDKPVASILLLRGCFTQLDQKKHSAKNLTIGELLRAKAAESDRTLAWPTEPDVASIAVELAFACMKYGYTHDGCISDNVAYEAKRSVLAYLKEWSL